MQLPIPRYKLTPTRLNLLIILITLLILTLSSFVVSSKSQLSPITTPPTPPTLQLADIQPQNPSITPLSVDPLQTRFRSYIPPSTSKPLSNLITSIHEHDQMTLQQSCSSITGGCNECYDVFGCHFCEHDQQCHAYGSWWGCLVGSSCTDPKCIRNQPEWVGYPSPSFLFALATLTVFSMIFLFGAFILHILYFGCKYICIPCFGQDENDQKNNKNNDVVIIHTHSDADNKSFVTSSHYVGISPTEQYSITHRNSSYDYVQSQDHTPRVSTVGRQTPRNESVTTSINGSSELYEPMSIEDNDGQTANWIGKKQYKKRRS